MLQEFINAIRAEHAGNFDLLIFADWLEERGGDLDATLTKFMSRRLVLPPDPRRFPPYEPAIGTLLQTETVTITDPVGTEFVGVYTSMEREPRTPRLVIDDLGMFRSEDFGRLTLVLQLLAMKRRDGIG